MIPPAAPRPIEDAIDRHAVSSRPSVRSMLLAGGILLGLSMVLSLAIGPTGISLASLPRALHSLIVGTPTAESLVLLQIRLPRLILGAFVGAALAVSGAMMQGLFRNPLADPGLIGVSSGAALAAVTTIVLGNYFIEPLFRVAGVYALPVAAFFGGFASTMVLVRLTRRGETISVSAMLLAGVALAAFCGAATGALAFASDDRELRDLTLWSLGSLAGASWPKVIAVLPFAIITLIVAPRLTRALNGLLLGEAEAYHLGIDVERTKRLCVVLTAALTGAAVAVAGVIGFVGIVVPHVIRLIAGPDHRIVLPAGAVLGAALVLVSDIIARMAVRPAELPLGIVLAIIGAPVFIHLVVRRGVAGE